MTESNSPNWFLWWIMTPIFIVAVSYIASSDWIVADLLAGWLVVSFIGLFIWDYRRVTK